MKKYLFLILFVFISVSPNNLFASEYSGKEYNLQSRDARITVTDVDISTITGLRTNEGILDIDIKHLKSGNKKDIRLQVVCSDNNYKNVADICNQEYVFDTASKRIHYVANTPKSKVNLQFVIYDNDNPNLKSYLLEKKIQLNYQSDKSKNSKVKITSPKDGEKVYFSSDFLLKWKTKSNKVINILNCGLDKENCSQINGVLGKKGKVYISADSIMSGNSLIKVENSVYPKYFDYVEVVALPR